MTPATHQPHVSRQMEDVSRYLERTFRRLFFRERGKAWIARIVTLLREGKPVRPLLERPRHLFPSLFIPFHDAIVFPMDLRSLVTRQPIHPRLAEFCGLCSSLASVTTSLMANDREPLPQERDMLLCVLEQFLAVFPAEKEFQGWLRKSPSNDEITSLAATRSAVP